MKDNTSANALENPKHINRDIVQNDIEKFRNIYIPPFSDTPAQ
jgi:hypothetical protein